MTDREDRTGWEGIGIDGSEWQGSDRRGKSAMSQECEVRASYFSWLQREEMCFLTLSFWRIWASHGEETLSPL